jgi:hypothetical protein
MREVIELRKGMATGATDIGARPAVAADGVDITSWRPDSKRSPRLVQAFIAGSAAASITEPASGTIGVELWGYALSQWWLLGALNDGAAIPIVSATQGFAESLNEIGDFDRLAVAGTVSAGTATYVFAPLERNMY